MCLEGARQGGWGQGDAAGAACSGARTRAAAQSTAQRSCCPSASAPNPDALLLLLSLDPCSQRPSCAVCPFVYTHKEITVQIYNAGMPII